MKKNLKLFNFVIQYDLWVVMHEGSDFDEAKALGMSVVAGGEEPSEFVRYTIVNARDIPSRLHSEKPLVAAAVSDEEYKEYQGSTIPEIFAKLNERPTP